MKKTKYKKGLMPIGESFKGESTKYVLGVYDGAMKEVAMAILQENERKEKMLMREAKIIRN